MHVASATDTLNATCLGQIVFFLLLIVLPPSFCVDMSHFDSATSVGIGTVPKINGGSSGLFSSETSWNSVSQLSGLAQVVRRLGSSGVRVETELLRFLGARRRGLLLVESLSLSQRTAQRPVDRITVGGARPRRHLGTAFQARFYADAFRHRYGNDGHDDLRVHSAGTSHPSLASFSNFVCDAGWT